MDVYDFSFLKGNDGHGTRIRREEFEKQLLQEFVIDSVLTDRPLEGAKDGKPGENEKILREKARGCLNKPDAATCSGLSNERWNELRQKYKNAKENKNMLKFYVGYFTEAVFENSESLVISGVGVGNKAKVDLDSRLRTFLNESVEVKPSYYKAMNHKYYNDSAGVS